MNSVCGTFDRCSSSNRACDDCAENYNIVTEREQDYAEILFRLSRSEDYKEVVTIERSWAGDVARYVVELENTITFLQKVLINSSTVKE